MVSSTRCEPALGCTRRGGRECCNITVCGGLRRGIRRAHRSRIGAAASVVCVALLCCMLRHVRAEDVTALSPLSRFADESFVLDVHGSQFLPDVSYQSIFSCQEPQCQIGSPPHAAELAADCKFVNTSYLRCDVAAWPYAAASTRVRIQRGDVRIALGGRAETQNIFTFAPVWNSLEVYEGTSTNREWLRVYGHGLHVGQNLSCVFERNGVTRATAADQVLGDEFLCRVAAWPHLEGGYANFSVAYGSGVLLSRQGPVLFKYKESFDRVVPSSGHSLGSQVITLLGGGFSTTRRDESADIYYCSFTCADTQSFSPSGMAIQNVSSALCVVPSWRAPPCISEVALYRYGIIRVPGNAHFRFLAGWQDASPLSSLNGGGTRITMRGAGFNPDLEYACRFQAAASAEYVSSRGEALTADSIICVSPQWISGNAANTSLSLIEFDPDGSSHVLPKITARQLVFEYAAGSASLVRPTAGFARGGYDITVFGEGFNQHANAHPNASGYSANFSQGSYSVLTYCSARSSQEIVCTAPSWEHGEASTVMTLLQGPVAVAPLNGVRLSFSFIAEWFGLAPNLGPIEQATNVTVYGAGFAVGLDYRCTWTPVSSRPALNTSAVADSAGRLTCTCPPALTDDRVVLSVHRVASIALKSLLLVNLTGPEQSDIFQVGLVEVLRLSSHSTPLLLAVCV